jgi:c-di-GMP-binding flagellar brake protein YcgR
LVAAQDAADMFDQAVQERALAVLTMQNGAEWRTFKSRFLERDPNRQFFVLDHEPCGEEALPPVTPGHYVGVSFRHRSRKVMFATVVEAKGQFVVDVKTRIAAVRYRWPDAITELQRRAYHRTPVPDGVALPASLWPGGAAARTQIQNATLAVVAGQLADISCGGARVTLSQNSPPDWADGATLGAELHLNDGRPPVATDVRFRGLRTDESGQVGVAIQFVGLELSNDGRSILQRLAGQVQRWNRQNLAGGTFRLETQYRRA